MSDFDDALAADMARAFARAFDALPQSLDAPKSVPLTIKKIGYTVPISNELLGIDAQGNPLPPYVAPKRTRRQRLRTWLSGWNYDLRHRLASKLVGFDVDDTEY